MHKVTGKNTTPDNEFQDEDRTTDPITRGTTIPVAWMNAVMEEIARCITNVASLNAATETIAQMKQLFDNCGQVYVDFVTQAAGGTTITDRGSKGGSASRIKDGEYQITWDTEFEDTDYNVVASLNCDVGFNPTGLQIFIGHIQTTGCKVYVRKPSTGADVQFNLMHISVRATGVQSDA